MSATLTAALDLRTIAPRERHALIFGRFDDLRPGEALQLVNDHDPIPLQYQLQDRSPGCFAWSYLEAGPSIWRVQIDKLAAADPGSCCSGGACCG